MFRLVGGAIDGSGTGQGAVFALAAASDDEIQRAVLRGSDAPGEGLDADDADVFLHPSAAIVGGLVDAASKGAGVEGGAGGIKEDVGDGVHRQAGVARGPVEAAIG